jgi:hypothetical protein
MQFAWRVFTFRVVSIQTTKCGNIVSMSISPELLEILRCPKCKSVVRLKDDGSGIKCTNTECALVYPVRDEIPVMLVSEATVEK